MLSQPLPSPAHRPFLSPMEKDTKKHVLGKGAWRRSPWWPRSPWSPRAAPCQEAKQQKRRLSPGLAPAASPSAAAASGSLDMAPGMALRQEDVLRERDLPLLQLLLPEQGSHPGRLHRLPGSLVLITANSLLPCLVAGPLHVGFCTGGTGPDPPRHTVRTRQQMSELQK